jgi:NAD(P) transhydrogenase subunit alpha
MTLLFCPRERRPGETRVAVTPETAARYRKLGLEVAIERGAGAAAFFPDAAYEAAGARILGRPDEGWREADLVLTVGPPGVPRPEAGEEPKPGAAVLGLLEPYRHPEVSRRLAARGASALALELLPRTTRAQSMDALSSQASIAGYKAVLLAGWRLPRYFPLLMTAAGTVPPGRVVVMGAGVAGLQAIATAKRLGAVVEVSDVRAAAKEQVESLGGRFIPLPEMPSGEGTGGYAREMGEEFLRRQREIVAARVAQSDVVITTAQVPGRPAPRLVTREMVESMRPGSVIVDIAIERGGNCELSVADQDVVHGGVLVLAPSNLPAAMPHDASMVYARNLLALVQEVWKEGAVVLDRGNEIVAGALVVHGGDVLRPDIVGADAHG